MEQQTQNHLTEEERERRHRIRLQQLRKRRKIRKIVTGLALLAIVLSSVSIGMAIHAFLVAEKGNTDFSSELDGDGITLLTSSATEEQTVAEDTGDVTNDFKNVIKGMSEEQKENTVFPTDQLSEFFSKAVRHKSQAPAQIDADRTVSAEVVPYDGVSRSIACWGDSMTEGHGTDEAWITVNGVTKDISYTTYPSELETLTGITTYNLGVGGESSRDIAMREGGIAMVTDRDLTIPEEGMEAFNLIAEDTGEVEYLTDYSGYGFLDEDKINRMYVGDSLYKVIYNGDMHMVYNKLAKNRPSNARVEGSSVTFPAGTRINTIASQDRKNDILIIEMGSNGGWDYDLTELVEQYDEMLTYANCQYYIIVGDTDDPSYNAGLGDDEWEATLRAAFGDHFINMRTYLMQNGLQECGLDTTYADAEGYRKGQISKQLRSDWTHLNAYGYYAKGIGIYEKGVELGYWK